MLFIGVELGDTQIVLDGRSLLHLDVLLGSFESTEFGMALRWFSFAVRMLLPRHSVMLVNCVK